VPKSILIVVRSVFFLGLLQPTTSPAETVEVRYREGVSHGFLVLRTQEGKPIADGDSSQVAQGDRVTSRMRFRFKDGSIYEQTTVFKRPMETVIDATSGQVTVRYTEDGKDKVLTERLELPPDVANGILFTLLKNVQRNVPKATVSYVAATPKPRIVHLEVTPQGQEPFSIGSYSHKAIHYVVKVKIGGVAGLVAALVGKQPPDIQAWVPGDDAPAFVRSDGPLYGYGPIWRMELAVPAVWPDSTAAARSQK
jgi:hypothetical protein